MFVSLWSALLLFLGGTLPSAAVPLPEEKPAYVLHIVDAESVSRPEPADATRLVYLLQGQNTLPTPLCDYLARVILSELYPDFSHETFKAQAVAARTFVLRSARFPKHSGADICADSACCQACLSLEALKSNLGDRFDSLYSRALSAVEATDGEVLTYEGKLCETTYFSCSGGRTESAAAVWGGTVPYLVSVDSPDEAAPNAFRTAGFSLADAKARLTAIHPEAKLSASPTEWFSAPICTEGGTVRYQSVGGVRFTGSQLRQAFSLPSACFTVSADDEGITVTTYGSGHRVGMSQFGAEAMAQKGSTYKEILAHYYPGTTLEIR